MNKTFYLFLSIIIIVFSLAVNSLGQSIEQRLFVVQNDQTIGGNFRIQVQVKGTSLPAANTLGSATIDVQFNNTHLTYVNSTLWAFGGAQGYSRSPTNNTTFIRIGVLGSFVNENGGGDPPGFDIGSTYTSWVQLNFTIQSATTTSLTINDLTNAIGLFENHSNEPNTGVINNQTLTSPVNIIDLPLPVELSSFTAKYIEKSVDLNWETKTEVNNYGFNVERRINEGEWNSITFIEGHGTTNSPKEYSYSDKDLFAGGNKFQYRLKQVDNNGSFEYSDVVEVEIVVNQYELSQNYPNPFNPSTTISFSLPESGKVILKIYNLIGEEIKTLVDGFKDAGIYKVNFNAEELASGMYLYILSTNGFTATKKMMLLK